MILERIEARKVIPVMAPESAADAVRACQALEAGGLDVVEITFRTEAAAEAIGAVARRFPEFALGAGTVTRLSELESAVESGAGFAVAPGLNPPMVERAKELGLPFFPGVCTPSEIDSALGLGCTVLKFFPAEAMGGVRTVRALYGPFAHRGVRFIPTGGVNGQNMPDYLALPGVIAVGGSWLVSPELVRGKDWGRITELARQAASMAAG